MNRRLFTGLKATPDAEQTAVRRARRRRPVVEALEAAP